MAALFFCFVGNLGRFCYVRSGSFTPQKINLHARTNMRIISEFLQVPLELRETESLTAVSVARG